MPVQDDYQVTLDLFQGPMDLLLYLIRRAEVDVQDIPIAAVTDQYLQFLRQIDDIDVEQAGEFLVTAATLIEIKSRTLVPVEPGAERSEDGGRVEDPTDPRFELVQQLLAYQAYRTASERIEDRRVEYLMRFPLRPSRVDRSELDEAEEQAMPPLELEDVHALDLAEAYEHIIASIDFNRIGDHLVEVDDTPIELHAEDLLDRLAREPQHRFNLLGAFQGRNRSQRIGMFLALLELVRMRRVTVVQGGGTTDDITVEMSDHTEVLPTVGDEFDTLVSESMAPGWHQEGAESEDKGPDDESA